MSTLTRLLLVLLSLLLSSPALLAQSTEELGFTETFGRPGEVGSFRVRFSRQGAGIVWLQALDHYVSYEARQKENHDSGDYLLLVDNGDHALRLFGGAAAGFGVDPATAVWQVDRRPGEVEFTLAGQNGLVLKKAVRHDQASRGFTVTVTLANADADAVGNVQLQLGGPALVNPKQASLFGDVSVAIAAAIDDGEIVTLKADPQGKQQPLELNPGVLQFAGSTNRFFGAFVWPLDDPSRAAMTGFVVDTLPPRPDVQPADNLTTRVRYGLQLQIPPKGGEASLSYGVYLGPKSYRVFDTLPEGEQERFAPILEVDLNPPCCGGVTIPGGRPMAKLLLTLLGWFYDVLGNWGFAIILLTILVRGSLFPLNFRMQKSMRAYGAKMAKLKPQLDAINKKHADDPKAKQQAMIAFQREHKIMPPLGGCLPMFLTMPIYIGLFTALRTAYDLRQQPFVAWIDDLSTSDALFQLGFWPHDFNLLPLLWIGLFVFMTLRQPLPTDPQQRQMQMMMRFMPILFGVMLYGYASALLVYMVTSMLWSLVESSIVKKILGPIDPNAGAMAPQVM